MKIHFTDLNAAKGKTDAVMVFPVGEDKKLSPQAQAFNKQAGGALARALTSGKFTGKRGQVASIVPPDNVKADRLLLLGTGDPAKLDLKALENLGGAMVPALNH